jgi:hypothetical protein
LDKWTTRHKAATYTGQHKHNKHRQTSMPRVGFEHMNPVFKWAKTVHALDRATTVISPFHVSSLKKNMGPTIRAALVAHNTPIF